MEILLGLFGLVGLLGIFLPYATVSSLMRPTLFFPLLVLISCSPAGIPPDSPDRPPQAEAEVYLLLYDGLPVPEGVSKKDVKSLGCGGDRIVRTKLPAVSSRLPSALEALSHYDPEEGSLLSPLPRIGVSFEKVEDVRGRTVVHMKGSPLLANSCDPVRLVRVVEETVKLYDPEAAIWLNRFPCEWQRLTDPGVPCS